MINQRFIGCLSYILWGCVSLVTVGFCNLF